MNYSKIHEILQKAGIVSVDHEEGILVQTTGGEIILTISQEAQKVIKEFFSKKIYEFDSDNRVLRRKNYAEFQVVKLDPRFYESIDYKFKSATSEVVELGKASLEFHLAHFESPDWTRYAPSVRTRIERRIAMFNNRSSRSTPKMRFEDLIFYRFRTAVFRRKGKYLSSEFYERARDRIRACLFHLAYTKHECWELKETIRTKRSSIVDEGEDDGSSDLTIPIGSFSSDAVSFYKIAKSSTFPSQKYLSYYHVLEYYFLRVADEVVSRMVQSRITRPGFRPDYQAVNEIIGIIKKHEMKIDETELLRMVLRKYVSEQELIQRIKDIEEKSKEKIYTKDRQVFGERLKISLEEGHALSNTAKVIKHIRNGLVHSSDRYDRDECLVPFSEAELIVSDYTPLVAFLAESVIIATSELPKEL